MKRRLIITGLGAVGVLVASAAPAHAINVNEFTDSRSIEVAVSDCSPSAALGTKCRGFVIGAVVVKTHIGVTTKNISVEGFDLTVNGPNGAANGPSVSGGSTGTGTVTIAASARTASLKFTIAMTCDSEPCAVSGLFAIKVSAGKGASSTYSTSGGSSSTEQPPNCRTSSGGSGSQLIKPAGKGTVKLGGVTKTLRPVVGADGSIQRGYSFNKASGNCV